MRFNKLVSTAVLCSALAAGTSACAGAGAPSASSANASASPSAPGIETLSADEIYGKAKDALKSAVSTKIDASGMNKGKAVKFTLAMDTKGNCTGTVTLDTASVEIISTQTWLKPDTTFWKAMAGSHGAQAAELFKGRYVTSAS